jgi:ABC-type transport system involved in cytochrome c biogenesis permease subunit
VVFSLPVAVEVAKHLEANPAARAFMDSSFHFLSFALILQAVWLGCYVYVREKVLTKKNRKKRGVFRLLLYIMVFMYFLTGVHNFANDFSIWLKMVMEGG